MSDISSSYICYAGQHFATSQEAQECADFLGQMFGWPSKVYSSHDCYPSSGNGCYISSWPWESDYYYAASWPFCRVDHYFSSDDAEEALMCVEAYKTATGRTLDIFKDNEAGGYWVRLRNY